MLGNIRNQCFDIFCTGRRNTACRVLCCRVLLVVSVLQFRAIAACWPDKRYREPVHLASPVDTAVDGRFLDCLARTLVAVGVGGQAECSCWRFGHVILCNCSAGQLIQRGKPHAPCAHCATIICHTFPCNILPPPLARALVPTNV